MCSVVSKLKTIPFVYFLDGGDKGFLGWFGVFGCFWVVFLFSCFFFLRSLNLFRHLVYVLPYSLLL